MPSQTLERRMKYLIDKLYKIYEFQIVSRQHIVENDRRWFKNSLQSTKPLYEVLNNDEISDKDKTSAIINYLNTKSTGNNTIEKVNEFWYRTFDFIDANPSYIKTHNARRIWENMCDNAKDLNVWSEDLGLIYTKMFDRALLIKQERIQINNQTTSGWLEQEENEEKQSHKIWAEIISYINVKRTLLPKRPTFWRFNKNGVYCETTDPKWYVVGHCGGACSPQPNRDEKLCASSHSEILDEYLKYWADSEKGYLKFGLELEFAIPKSKLNDFFNSCQKAGLCDKNLISVGRDSTVHKPSSIRDNEEWIGLEVTTQPLRYSKAKEVFAKLGKIAEDNGGKFGNTAGAGGHIHMDKPKSGFKQIQIVKAFIAQGDNLPNIFGRGTITTDYDGDKIYKSGYSSTDLGLKIKKINCEEDFFKIENCITFKKTITIEKQKTEELQKQGLIDDCYSVGRTDYTIQAETRGALNFYNKHTIEFRGFSSRPDPDKNLENLAKMVAPILGNDVVYDKQEDKQQILKINQDQLNINNKQDEFLLTLRQLNLGDEAIEFAKKIKFDDGLTATQMLSKAINAWNEHKKQANSQVEQNYEFEENNERSR